MGHYFLERRYIRIRVLRSNPYPAGGKVGLGYGFILQSGTKFSFFKGQDPDLPRIRILILIRFFVRVGSGSRGGHIYSVDSPFTNFEALHTEVVDPNPGNLVSSVLFFSSYQHSV